MASSRPSSWRGRTRRGAWGCALVEIVVQHEAAPSPRDRVEGAARLVQPSWHRHATAAEGRRGEAEGGKVEPPQVGSVAPVERSEEDQVLMSTRGGVVGRSNG